MRKTKLPIEDWERIERDRKYPVEITQRKGDKNGIDSKRKKLRVSSV